MDSVLAAFDPFSFIIWAIITAGLSYAISALTAKVPKPDIQPPDAFNEPDVREGVSYPIVFGTVYIENPVIAWFGDIEVIPLIDHKTYNTGFNNKRMYYQVGTQYNAGIHFIICQGVTDGIKQIKNNDVVVWPTALDITAINVDGASEADIDEQSVFGGRYDGGGLVGTVSFLYGGSAQTQNDYLFEQLGATVPAYRGVTSAVVEGANIGNSPYLQGWKFLVKRTDILTDGSAQWYSAKAVINTYDLNPAHIIRECYTNTVWGLGISTALFDSTTWEAVADDLYDEGFGLSMKWEGEQNLHDFINDVLRHIQAKIYQDPTTGYIVLKLIRDDYVAGDLDEYDDSDIVLVNDFVRSTVYESVNAIEMTFWDRLYNKPIVIPDNDIASYTMQNNKQIFQSREYYGVMDSALAGQVIARDRMEIGSFPASMTIKVKRTMYSLRPGDVFKLTYPPLSLDEMIVRVIDINFGTLKDGTITMHCVEDIFSLSTILFAEVPDTAWDYPDLSPSESPAIKIIETPYYLVKSFINSDEYFDTIKDGTDGLALIMSAFANNSPDFELEFREDTGDSFVDKGTNVYTHTAILEENMSVNATQITLDISGFTLEDRDVVYATRVSRTGTVNYAVGIPIFIGNEILILTAIDFVNDTITVYRGAFDTVPETHSINDYIYFPTYFTTFMDENLIADGDTPGAKVYPNTPTGTLDSTTIINGDEFDSRLVRPYPPDDILINGSSFASSFSGQPTITWYDRDRTEINTIQYTGLHTASAEAGTTYVLKIYDEDNNLVRTEDPVTSPYEYAWEDEMDDCGLGSGDPLNTQLRFVLSSKRDGYDSFQSIDITVARV